MKIYTGIGSRETPADVQTLMTRIAKVLAKHDWVLRSGGADGADSAFEAGANLKEIYIPWNGFNGHYVDNIRYYLPEETEQVKDFVYDYHPNGLYLKAGAFKLMVRNTYQVLGATLDKPSDVVFCWTSDGKASGGTGQAMRIAKDYKIEIVNLFHINQLTTWLNKNKISLA